MLNIDFFWPVVIPGIIIIAYLLINYNREKHSLETHTNRENFNIKSWFKNSILWHKSNDKLLETLTTEEKLLQYKDKELTMPNIIEIAQLIIKEGDMDFEKNQEDINTVRYVLGEMQVQMQALQQVQQELKQRLEMKP